MTKELTLRRVRLAIVVLIVLVALGQRVTAAHRLPVDADEPVYAWSAAYYAGLMARGEWAEIPQVTYTAEHPVFVRLLYALGLRVAGYEGPPTMVSPHQNQISWEWGDDRESLGIFLADRYISVAFGTLQVLVVALVNPLAGAVLAIHTMTVKYTAQIYLEAVPAFAITASFLAYDRARRKGDGETGPWFWLSAALLGLAAASKYTYAAVGLAMVPFIVWQQRKKPWNIALYGGLALAVFFVLNPILWPAPIERLLYSLRFHQSYTGSAEVARYDYSWWQPISYMTGAGSWHPGVFWFPFDIAIFLGSLVGLWFLRRQNSLFTAWYLTGWLILFLWPTKWPQYTLIVTPALCLSVGAIGQAIVDRFDLRLDQETWERIAFYLPDHTFWIAPPKGLIIAVIVMIALYGIGSIVYRVNHIRQRQGWETYSTENGRLVGNTVTALSLDDEGRVWVGTRNGVSIYTEDEQTTLLIPQVTTLTPGNDGEMWIGTESGIAQVRGREWITTTTRAMGLPGARVRAIAVDPAERVWVGTLAGVAFWDGTTWRAFSPDEGGLSSDAVLALEMDAQGRVWIGTDSGLVILDLADTDPVWSAYTAFGSELPANSVRALEAEDDGMWIGTGGGGLCFWEMGDWTCYRTGNSDIPWNTIAALELDNEGRIWAATEQPARSGGAVAVFDGMEWRNYTSRNSGLATGQVTAILADLQGRFWFGTYGAGVSVYDPEE